MAKLAAERDLILAIPFDEVLGYCCPICRSVGVGAKWANGTNFCPKCGQRIKLVNSGADWQQLVKDAEKIPNVIDTNIVTTQIDFTEGLSHAKNVINGVFTERMKTYNDKNAQIEGQLSLF